MAGDHDNQHTKFSALNVDFSAASHGPLGSRGRQHTWASKKGTPSKKLLLYSCWLV